MQKMDSVGQLAAVDAHDYNKLLPVILGNSDLLLTGGDLNDPEMDNVGKIHKAAQRAARMTQQLLAFSRHQMMQVSKVDTHLLVNNVAKMIGSILQDSIDLKIESSRSILSSTPMRRCRNRQS